MMNMVRNAHARVLDRVIVEYRYPLREAANFVRRTVCAGSELDEGGGLLALS